MLIDRVLANAFDLFSYKMATLDEEKMYTARDIRLMWVQTVKEAAENLLTEKKKTRKKKG